MKVFTKKNNRVSTNGKSYPVAWFNGSICFFNTMVEVGVEMDVMIVGRVPIQIKTDDGAYQPASMFVAPVTEKHKLMTVGGFCETVINLPAVANDGLKKTFVSSNAKVGCKTVKIGKAKAPVYIAESKAKLYPCEVWVEINAEGRYKAVGVNRVEDIDLIVQIDRGELKPTLKGSGDFNRVLADALKRAIS